MIKKTETELLQDQIVLLQRRLIENGRMLEFVNTRNAMLQKTCQAAGAELRELQAKARNRGGNVVFAWWVVLWVLAAVITWVAS